MWLRSLKGWQTQQDVYTGCMNATIPAKTVNGKTQRNFNAVFSFDKFDPDAITVDFNGNVWLMDREMLYNGGDMGGDVKIIVTKHDTEIFLIRENVNATIVFDTKKIHEFLDQVTAPISIPVMREAQIDNFIVEFHNWNEGLVW